MTGPAVKYEPPFTDPRAMQRRAQKLEAVCRLYWDDISEWKRAALARAAQLPDSCAILPWDDLSEGFHALLRTEITRRLRAREVVSAGVVDGG